MAPDLLIVLTHTSKRQYFDAVSLPLPFFMFTNMQSSRVSLARRGELSEQLQVPPTQSLVNCDYWNSYYEKKLAPTPPSQFACFVAQEFKDHSLFVDIGCGNGRDSLFFSYLGHEVIGVDKSQIAIDFCKSQLLSREDSLTRFMASDVVDLNIKNDFWRTVSSIPKVIYSRFFLHAIPEAEEDAFIEFARALCNSPQDKVALEFRTLEDSENLKQTKVHYRRFISTQALKAKLTPHFHIDYAVVGLGMAKYGLEDAHVCRLILSARQSTTN